MNSTVTVDISDISELSHPLFFIGDIIVMNLVQQVQSHSYDIIVICMLRCQISNI